MGGEGAAVVPGRSVGSEESEKEPGQVCKGRPGTTCQAGKGPGNSGVQRMTLTKLLQEEIQDRLPGTGG